MNFLEWNGVVKLYVTVEEQGQPTLSFQGTGGTLVSCAIQICKDSKLMVVEISAFELLGIDLKISKATIAILIKAEVT
jgi:hypothetical protein